MKLREKTLLVIGVTLVCLILGLYASSQIVIMSSFSDLECRDMLQNVGRALDAMNATQLQLGDAAAYWAIRNDTYAFAKDLDPRFIESNMADETFAEMRINLLLLTNSYGRITFAKAFDLQNGCEVPVPGDLQEQLSLYGFCPGCLDKQKRYSGLILLSDGPMMIVSHPIMTGKRQGPSRGRLIMGRYLNPPEVDVLADVTHLNLTLEDLEDADISDDFESAKLSLSEVSPVFVTALNSSTIAGYALLRDIYGNPALLLRVDSHRDIYMHGQTSMQYFILLFVAACIMIVLIVLVYLDKSVLSSLAEFSSRVYNIGKVNDLSARVQSSGKDDELASLAGSINAMLAALEKSQSRLNESEKRYRMLAEAALDMIFMIDRSGRLQYLNSWAAKQLGCRPEDAIGKRMVDLLLPDVSCLFEQNVEQAFTTCQPVHFDGEAQFLGARSWIYTSLVPMANESGDVDLVLGISRDITEHKMAEAVLKQAHDRLEQSVQERTLELAVANQDLKCQISERMAAEEKIAASLREKEVLLKEIHHRVKNNLQVISSLISLQSNCISDPKARAMFKDSQDRIRTMALIHEKLYRSGSLARINFADYICNLTSYLLLSYEVAPGQIELRTSVDDIFLGIDTAIPCGLIVNELVSNSLKYAFPDGRKGEILIEMRSNEDGSLALTVGDDGIGLPEDLDFRSAETLGMQLVNVLAEQIHGTVEVVDCPGAVFKIVFWERRYRDRAKV